MLICIPVTDDRGLESRVSIHFGSAPGFLVVDTANGSCRRLANDHPPGEQCRCAPIGPLLGQGIETVLAGGIGRGALGRLEAAGIAVFRAPRATVAEAVAAFECGTLERLAMDSACVHGHGHQHHGGQHEPHDAGASGR